MGDDYYLPSPVTEARDHSSAATGGSNIFINNLGKTGFTIIVSLVGLALGLAISAIVIVIVVGSQDRAASKAATDAAERRVMDMAWLAKQEAALAREDYLQLRAELGKRGITFSTDGH